MYPVPNNKIVTIKEALEGVTAKTFANIKYPIELMKQIPQGKNITSASKELVDKYFPKLLSKKFMKDIMRRDSWDKPTCTVIKMFIPFAMEPKIHPAEHRYYSIEELCALCSFPTDWKFANLNYVQRHARLGNAVMPNFMKAIAETIKKEILKT